MQEVRPEHREPGAATRSWGDLPFRAGCSATGFRNCGTDTRKDPITVAKQRPKNLDLFSIKFPVTSISSILHRISGVILFLVIPILLYMLSLSLDSTESFNQLRECMTGPVAKFVLWGIVASLLFHLVAGIRHLLMDAGLGESLSGGRTGAYLVLILGAILAILAGFWIW